MSAIIENIVTEQGVTYSKAWDYTNTHGVDPADYTAAISLREYPDAETATLEVTTTEGDNGSIITLSGTAASIVITLTATAEDMLSLNNKRYVYDILLTDTSDNVRMPYAGEIDNRILVTR